MADTKTRAKRRGKKRGKKSAPDPRQKRNDALGRPPMPAVGELGERIDALVKSRFNGNRSALAEAAGLVPSRLSETIRGLTTPTMATLERIASACGISLSELVAATPPVSASAA